MPMSSAALVVGSSFAVMVTSNVLSTKKFFGGKDNKVISDSHPTYVTPDGLTFAVWAVIYTFLLVTTIAQAAVSEGSSADALLSTRGCLGLDTRELLSIAFLLNVLWLPVFSNEKYWAAFAIMVLYLLALLCTWINTVQAGTVLDYILVGVGVSLNTSWIVVATAVNGFLVFGEAGWKDQFGVAGTPIFASIIVWCVAVIACVILLLQADPAWGFVAAWALRGIYRMQTIENIDRFPTVALNKQIALSAQVSSAIVLFAVGVQLVASGWSEYKHHTA